MMKTKMTLVALVIASMMAMVEAEDNTWDLHPTDIDEARASNSPSEITEEAWNWYNSRAKMIAREKGYQFPLPSALKEEACSALMPASAFFMATGRSDLWGSGRWLGYCDQLPGTLIDLTCFGKGPWFYHLQRGCEGNLIFVLGRRLDVPGPAGPAGTTTTRVVYKRCDPPSETCLLEPEEKRIAIDNSPEVTVINNIGGQQGWSRRGQLPKNGSYVDHGGWSAGYPWWVLIDAKCVVRDRQCRGQIPEGYNGPSVIDSGNYPH